jgi:heptosyltransferase-3
MDTKNPRLLLLRFGGLGDLLAVLPSISYLSKTMPDGDFTLVCREEYGGLFKDAGFVDRLVPAGGRRTAALFGGLSGADPETGCWAQSFGLAVAWMQKPPGPSLEETLRSMGIPEVRVIALPAHLTVPVSRFFFDATASFFPGAGANGPGFDECVRLTVSERTAASVRGLRSGVGGGRGPFAVVHPGSGGESKRWPLENFLEIVRRLADRGIPGVLVSGDAEERPSFSGPLEEGGLPPGWTWLRRPELSGLTALLAEASFYVGNDSGVTHLAAACGIKVLALFREDMEPAWRPFGRTRVLAAGTLPEISTDSVWLALREENIFLK